MNYLIFVGMQLLFRSILIVNGNELDLVDLESMESIESEQAI